MIAHRKAVEKQYRGKISVYGFKSEIIDSETVNVLAELIKDEPCYLQRRPLKSADSDGVKSSVDYSLKVMCAPELNVPAGARIKVVQDGKLWEFKYTGDNFPYPTHQELVTVVKERV